jgi:hypothetical protein
LNLRRKTEETEQKGDNASFYLWGIIGISTIVLLGVTFMGPWISIDPTSTMVLIVVFGVIDLLAVLTIAGKAFTRTGMECKDEALGLPAGSIRALIALSLIIIFAMMAIFMYNQLTPNGGLLIKIDGNQTFILPNGTALTNPAGIQYLTEPSQAQRDFSTQTLTTVSTLVVALAGFYFGTKAASGGKDSGKGDEETEDAKEPEYDLKISPKGEAQPNKPLTLKVEAKPKGGNIHLLSVEGDNRSAFDLDKLKASSEILYTPTDKHENKVMAIFALIVGEKIKVTNEVSIVLEDISLSSKQTGKATPGKTIVFEVKTISASGKVPSVIISGDEPSTIDKTKLDKGEFSYKPSSKGTVRPNDFVILEVELEGKPDNIVRQIKIQLTP